MRRLSGAFWFTAIAGTLSSLLLLRSVLWFFATRTAEMESLCKQGKSCGGWESLEHLFHIACMAYVGGTLLLFGLAYLIGRILAQPAPKPVHEPDKSDKTRGFTLLELSIVLVLIGFILAGLLSTLLGHIQEVQYASTSSRMDAIERAILDFKAANNRIPCPSNLTAAASSVNYGVEAANPGGCTGGTPAANFTATGANAAIAAEGGVPTRALRLPDDYMYDGWGNRFRYAVDVSATATNAFSSIQGTCGAISVEDSTGSANRSTGAIYALLSHGPNAHGAYTANGVPVNASSVNASELINCHCTSTGASSTYSPTYVEMAPTVDTSNSLDNFDDIVTFKEYWQLYTPNSPSVTTKQTAPVGVAGLTFPGPTNYGEVSTFLQSVSAFDSTTGIASPAIPPDYANQTNYSWSPDNKFLFVNWSGCCSGSNPAVYLYQVLGATSLKQVTTPTNMPTNMGGGGDGPLTEVAWSHNNQYLAVSGGNSPYIYVWQRCGSSFTQLASLPAWEYPSGIEWSPNDNYLIPISYEWNGIYKRSGNTFSIVSNSTLFSVGYRENGAWIAFSPNGQFAAEEAGDNANLQIYQVNASGIYVPLTEIALETMQFGGGPGQIAFSPDGNYIASVQTAGSSYVGLNIVQVSGTTFTKLTNPTIPGGLSNLRAPSWTPDSQYLAVWGNNWSSGTGITIFRNVSGTFTNIGSPTAPSGFSTYYQGYGFVFSN